MLRCSKSRKVALLDFLWYDALYVSDNTAQQRQQRSGGVGFQKHDLISPNLCGNLPYSIYKIPVKPLPGVETDAFAGWQVCLLSWLAC